MTKELGEFEERQISYIQSDKINFKKAAIALSAVLGSLIVLGDTPLIDRAFAHIATTPEQALLVISPFIPFISYGVLTETFNRIADNKIKSYISLSESKSDVDIDPDNTQAL